MGFDRSETRVVERLVGEIKDVGMEICFRSVQPGRGAHYGDPRGERCLQLSRRVPR